MVLNNDNALQRTSNLQKSLIGNNGLSMRYSNTAHAHVLYIQNNYMHYKPPDRNTENLQFLQKNGHNLVGRVYENKSCIGLKTHSHPFGSSFIFD